MPDPEFIIDYDKQTNWWRLTTQEWVVDGYGAPPTVRKNPLGKLGCTVLKPPKAPTEEYHKGYLDAIKCIHPRVIELEKFLDADPSKLLGKIMDVTREARENEIKIYKHLYPKKT